jgi:hypothetical protein
VCIIIGNRLSSFFTIARFEPDSIAILGLLCLASFVLYEYGLVLSAGISAGAFAIIFCIESAERIHLGTAKPSQIVGSRCLVINRVAGRADRGIVRVYEEEDGELNPELWSAESGSTIEEGRTALVTGIRSVILLVEEE